MKFDGSTSNPRTGHATIKVLLTRPSPDQMVTQAQQTLKGDYRHGAVAFTSADLIVKLITRGDPADATDYARAAVWTADGGPHMLVGDGHPAAALGAKEEPTHGASPQPTACGTGLMLRDCGVRVVRHLAANCKGSSEHFRPATRITSSPTNQ